MKIFDCFMFYDEELLLDIRLNILDKYVDYFVISESTKTHQGKHKKLNFNIKTVMCISMHVCFCVRCHGTLVQCVV